MKKRIAALLLVLVIGLTLLPGSVLAERYEDGEEEQFECVADRVLAGVPWGSDVEMLLYFHDYLVSHCRYDEDSFGKYDDYALEEGCGDSEGYARAFQYLCECADLYCDVVYSGEMGRYWNIVQVEDDGIDYAYYYIDCALDDGLDLPEAAECFCLHTHFLECKEDFMKTHPSRDWTVGESQSVYNYTTTENYRYSWWRSLKRPVQWAGGRMCYAKPADSGRVFFRDSVKGAETAVTIQGGESWKIWGGTDPAPESYVTVTSLKGDFYYSTPTQIWKLTAGGEMRLVYTLRAAEQAKGYLYGILGGADELRYFIGQSPDQPAAAVGTLSYSPTVAGITPDRAAAAAGETVTWTAEASGGMGALKYRFYVYRDGSPVQKGDYAKANTLSYAPALPGTYTVRVYVKDGNGTWESLTGGAVSVAPAAPANLKVTSGLEGITVKWSAVNGAGKYRVIRTVDGVTTKIKVNGTSWTDTGVQAGKTCTYSVQAQTEGGIYSAASETKSLYYPLGISVKVSGKKANVSWTPVTGATKYQLYCRGQTDGKYGSWVLIYSGKGTSFADTPGSGTWQYRVRAVVGAEKTPYSNRKKITI